MQPDGRQTSGGAEGESLGRWRLATAWADSELRPSSNGGPAQAADWSTRLRDGSRRVVNVAVAAVAIPLFLPLMALIAVAIKLDSRGPVLYRQKRVGLDRRRSGRGSDSDGRRSEDRGGRIFTIYKFRTMYWRDEGEDQVWARPDDPRVTRVGRFLRRTRLDELPQLFNVLRGDMNIVGPRPEQPQIFQRLRNEVSEYEKRQQVLPGITGWAQVNQHYDRCIDDVKKKVDLDLEYISRRSPVEDLKIMAKTIPVVIQKRGGI